MRIFKAVTTVCCVALMGAALTAIASAGKTVITFRERPAGEPQPLRAWFYPGRAAGEEFVYPKARALELARSENTTVLSPPAELPLEISEPIKTVDEPVVAQLREAPVQAIRPTGEQVKLAQVITPPPAEIALASLPRTASSLRHVSYRELDARIARG